MALLLNKTKGPAAYSAQILLVLMWFIQAVTTVQVSSKSSLLPFPKLMNRYLDFYLLQLSSSSLAYLKV